MKLMITQGTSAFAQRVARQIQQSSTTVQVYFGAADELPKVLESTGKYIRISSFSDASFVHQLLKSALDLELNYVLPLDYSECRELSEATMLFEEYGITLLMPNLENWSEENLLLNPPSALGLQLIINGHTFPAPSERTMTESSEKLSGLYSLSDDGEMYWCLARNSQSSNF